SERRASIESFTLATRQWRPFSRGALQSRLRQFRRDAYRSLRDHRGSGKTWSDIGQARLRLPLPFSTGARTLCGSGRFHAKTSAARENDDRIAIAGHSFGGQLTLLAAERDNTVRAAVTFGAAAGSWEDWPELRKRLLGAVRKTSAPLMLIHASNDYSTAPGNAM